MKVKNLFFSVGLLTLLVAPTVSQAGQGNSPTTTVPSTNTSAASAEASATGATGPRSRMATFRNSAAENMPVGNVGLTALATATGLEVIEQSNLVAQLEAKLPLSVVATKNKSLTSLRVTQGDLLSFAKVAALTMAANSSRENAGWLTLNRAQQFALSAQLGGAALQLLLQYYRELQGGEVKNVTLTPLAKVTGLSSTTLSKLNLLNGRDNQHCNSPVELASFLHDKALYAADDVFNRVSHLLGQCRGILSFSQGSVANIRQQNPDTDFNVL